MHREKAGSFWPLLSLVILLFLFSYGNQLIYRYVVPAGGDALGHNTIVSAILNGNIAQIFQYHTAWHVTVALTSLLTHIRPITLMAWFAPGLLVTMGLALYYFNARFYGRIAGLASLVIIGFFSLQPLQTLSDGGFPNVLAAGTVLPLVFIIFEWLFREERSQAIWGIFGISLVALFFSHHITTIYALPILIIAALIFLLQRAASQGKSIGWIILGLAFAIPIGLILAGWFLNTSNTSVAALARAFVTMDWAWPFIQFTGKLDNPNAMWELGQYPNAIGELVVYLGVLGALCAFVYWFIPSQTSQWRASIILILWTGLLLWASQTPAVGFPVRLARDLAVPLALLGGIFVQFVHSFITKREIPVFFWILFLVACGFLGWLSFKERYQRILAHNPLIYHLSVDSEAADYITENLPLDAKIDVFQDDIFLDAFTPLHIIEKFDGDEVIKTLTEPQNHPKRLRGVDYLYVELRHDRDESWINNQGIVEKYKKVPYATLVATFKQPEKEVFLFKLDQKKLKPSEE
jgi:hypothetical protein